MPKAAAARVWTISADERDDAEVEADQGGGGERVGDAALEDEVHVHQAVADDGPAEGQRQEDQRERTKF